MNQVRPYMRESVKSLEKVFSDYAFNKKVLTAVRAELKLRTTKSAAALLLKVQRRLEEIEKRDRFGAKTVRKVTPSATSTPSQLPLIDTPIVKLAHVERPVAPPTQPRPQPISTGASPKATASPLPRRSQHDSPVAADRPPQPTASPARQDAQAKVKAEADRAVSVSLVGLIVLFAVIALLFSWGKKLNNDATAQGQSPVPINRPVSPSRAKAPPPTAESAQREYEAFMEAVIHERDKRIAKVMGSAKAPSQQSTRQPEALNKAQPQSFDERLKDYRNTVDALLN